MRRTISTPILLLAGLGAALSAREAPAQEPAATPSPYAGLEAREIKALSESDVEGLLAGEGMGYALAAELNGWPGPRHALELADALHLTPEQRERIETIRERMSERARGLGKELIAAESALDRLFAEGDPAAPEVEAATAEAGRIEAALRAAHLAAHLETRRALNDAQVARYVALRGYADPEAAGEPTSEHGEGHAHR